MNGTLARHGRHAAPFLAAVLLAAVSATPVAAEWQDETITEGWRLGYPSLAVRGDDTTLVAYGRWGSDPGILVADDVGGTWESTRITSDDDWFPDLALGNADSAHLAYARSGASATIHYATDATGSWVDTVVASEVSVGPPAIAVAPGGAVHLVYPAEGFTPGIYHVTNASGSWVRTRLTSGTHDWEPDLVIDEAGVLHLVFARYAPESRGIYYAAWSGTGAISWQRATTGLDDYPAIGLDAAGKPHVVFSRYSSSPDVLAHATNAGGAWATEEVDPGDLDGWYGEPSIAFDAAGQLQVAGAFHVSSSSHSGAVVKRWVREPTGWRYYDVPYGGSGEGGNTALGFASDGSLRLAFDGTSPNAGIELYVTGSTTAAVAVSQLDTWPSITRTTGDARRIALQRRAAAGELVLASEAGPWALETAATAPTPPSATDLAIHTDGTARVVTGSTLASNMTGSWLTFTELGYGDVTSAVAIDASGVAHVVTGQSQGLWYRRMPGVSEYVWPCGESVTCVGGEEIDDSDIRDPQPDIALNAAGVPYVAAIVGDCLSLYRRISAGNWQFIEPIVGHMCGGRGPDRWPAIAIDAAGKIHIAYEQLAGDGSSDRSGIYYTTNASGSWVNRVISRSSADGPPSIAIGAGGKVYIAFARGYWAASPGLYLATNRTGAWTTVQVTTDFAAGDPGISVAADGTVDLVFASGSDGIRLLDEQLAGLASGPIRIAGTDGEISPAVAGSTERTPAGIPGRAPAAATFDPASRAGR